MKTSSQKQNTIKHFTQIEDQIIKSLARPNSENDWCRISKSLKNRTARQCRDRWNNYLNPTLNKKEWTKEEDELLVKLFNEKGPQWKSFTVALNGRSINDVRNRCFKLLRKKEKLEKSEKLAKSPILSNTPAVEKEMKDEPIPISVDEITLDGFDDDDDGVKMNFFDPFLFSNFDSISFDSDELFQEFE